MEFRSLQLTISMFSMIFHKFDVTFFGLCNQFLSVIPQLISASKSTSVKHCYEYMPWHPTSTDPEKIALLYEAIKSLFSSLFQNQTGLVQQQKVIIKQISRVQHTVSFVFWVVSTWVVTWPKLNHEKNQDFIMGKLLEHVK